MSTLAVTVAGVGAGFTDGGAGAVLSLGGTPADLAAGLGAALLAVIGVIVVRHLNSPGQTGPLPTPKPRSTGDDFKRAA